MDDVDVVASIGRRNPRPTASPLTVAWLVLLLPALFFAAFYVEAVMATWLGWGRTAEDRIRDNITTIVCLFAGLAFVVPGFLCGLLRWLSSRRTGRPARLGMILYGLLLIAFLTPVIYVLGSALLSGGLSHSAPVTDIEEPPKDGR